MTMTKTVSNKDRARNFMKYFMKHGGGLDDVDALETAEWECVPVREIYRFMIMGAAQSYIDDVVFTFNIPMSRECNCSEFGKEVLDDLNQLSTNTLRVLAVGARRGWLSRHG